MAINVPNKNQHDHLQVKGCLLWKKISKKLLYLGSLQGFPVYLLKKRCRIVQKKSRCLAREEIFHLPAIAELATAADARRKVLAIRAETLIAAHRIPIAKALENAKGMPDAALLARKTKIRILAIRQIVPK